MSPDHALRNGGQLIVDALRIHGTDTTFCVPGESFIEVLDALYDASNEVKLVTCRHEGAAANMAEAYGKLTGRPGICIVTRGPGACHASLGVHNAQQDSTPLILLVGQVPRDHMGREAFQEIDYTHMFGKMTKWVAQIDSPSRIPEMMHRAFTTATSGRPGPVVLAMPEDMLRESCEAVDTPPYQTVNPAPRARDIDVLAGLLREAQRPMMIVGGGGWTPEACRQIVAFAGSHNLATCCTFRRQDIFDNEHPNYIGDLAFVPDPKLIARLGEADLVIAVGTFLGELATRGFTLFTDPERKPKLVHVHPEASVLGRVYATNLNIQSGVVEFAAAVSSLPHSEAPPPWGAWAHAAREDFLENLVPPAYDGDVDLGKIMLALRERLPADAILVMDAGNSSGWPQRFLSFRRPRTMLGPQSGAMAYGVPAAVAASIVHPGRLVVGFMGDGGFMMADQELATAVRYGARPILLVFNNGMYGTIRMHQEKGYPGRVIGTELTNPDFVALAKSFGAHGELVERTEDFMPAFERAVDSSRASVIEIRMDPDVISARTTLTAMREKARAH